MAVDPIQDHPTSGLSRMWAAFDRPGSWRLLTGLVLAVCVISFGLQFTYEKKAYLSVQKIYGFYGMMGFAGVAIALLAARILQPLLAKDEAFYGDTGTEGEDYPTDDAGDRS